MTGSLGRARAALRSRDFRFLLAGRLTSQFADGLFQAFLVAQLVFFDAEREGTALGVAKAYALLVIPFSLLGPFAGVLIDRWSRRWILVSTPLVRTAACLVLVALGGEGWPVYATALVVVSLNRFFLASASSVMPMLVPDEDLLVANSMATVGGTVLSFVGIVAGTKLAEPIGGRGVLLVLAAVWPVCAALASRIGDPLRAREPVSVRGAVGRVLGDLRSGVRRLAAAPAALGAIVSASFNQFLVGLMTVLSIVVFKEQFEQGVGSYGNLIAAGGVGVLAGTLTVGWFEPRLRRARIVAVSFAVAGLTTLLVAPALTDETILLLAFALGLTFSWMKVPADTIVQETVPNRFRGRVFALYDIGYANARVVAAAVAVPVIPRLSTAWLVALVGLAYLAWTPVLPAWVRRRPAVQVRFYAGGRADEVPRSVVIGGEEEPVEVLRSWTEERDGRRLRRFRLRTSFGDRLDIVGEEGGDRWFVEREIPVEVTPDPR